MNQKVVQRYKHLFGSIFSHSLLHNVRWPKHSGQLRMPCENNALKTFSSLNEITFLNQKLIIRFFWDLDMEQLFLQCPKRFPQCDPHINPPWVAPVPNLINYGIRRVRNPFDRIYLAESYLVGTRLVRRPRSTCSGSGANKICVQSILVVIGLNSGGNWFE